MSTIQNYQNHDINRKNKLFSSCRSIIETSFYGNNVTKINHLAEAYQLASTSPGAIVTDLPIEQPEHLGLPTDAKVIVFNDGNVVGRTAAARRIIGQPDVSQSTLNSILREAIFQGRHQDYYHAETVVGLADSFMVKAHVLLPTGFENNLYSYLLNFQLMTETYRKEYNCSKTYDEGDIYIYGDPNWTHPDYPNGLALFDPEHNVAAILGLRYFGEFKKATLTLAWGIANRNGFISCHGGLKQYELIDNNYTAGFFGLSGSGKSTLTLSQHQNKFNIKVLHDDAFIIDSDSGETIALEPSYFDKTQDYPMTSDAIKYFLTCQNIGVTLNELGEKVLVTEDIRNGNGRTVKSRFVIPNRVDSLSEQINGIFWIMKDDTLPPVIKINDPVLASIFGATLATKRSTAENVVSSVDKNKLVIEPFANPFRCYPLSEDYKKFRDLFQQNDTECYLLNTGYFNDQKVTPKETLDSIEKIVTKSAHFDSFYELPNISYLPIEGHEPPFENSLYLEKLRNRMKDRLCFIEENESKLSGYDALPKEASVKMSEIISLLSE